MGAIIANIRIQAVCCTHANEVVRYLSHKVHYIFGSSNMKLMHHRVDEMGICTVSFVTQGIATNSKTII